MKYNKHICEICGKPSKENTGGNMRYCQGHSWIEVMNREERLKNQQSIERGEK